MPKPGAARVSRGASANPVAGLVKSFSEEFGKLGRKIVSIIDMQMRAGSKPLDAVNFAFNAVGMTDFLKRATLDRMVTAVAIGYGVEPALLANALGIRNTFLNSFWPDDEFNLSSRIASKAMAKAAASTISANLLSAHGFQNKVATWREMANNLANATTGTQRSIYAGKLPKVQTQLITAARMVASGDVSAVQDFNSALKKANRAIEKLGLNGAPNQELRASYVDVVTQAEGLKARGLEKAIERAVIEKTRANAERIARTEIARAYGTGFYSRAEVDTDVIGVRSMLSSRHPISDICDFHAKADLYGMGAGVSPKDKNPPYPYHPHCLCVLVPVYEGEAELNQEMDLVAGKRLLKTLSPSERQKLLGVVGAAEFEKNPGAWEKHLKGWEGHRHPLRYPVKIEALPRITPSTSEPLVGVEATTKTDNQSIPPKRLIEKVVGLESKIRLQKYESFAFFSPEGELLGFKDGGKSSVNVGDFIPMMKGTIATHNHPGGWGYQPSNPMHGGNSFSIADLLVAVRGEVKEMRAVSPLWDHIYRPPNGVDSKRDTERLKTAYAQAKKQVNARMMSRISKKEISIDQANADGYHEIAEEFTKRFGGEYFRIPKGSELN